MKDKKHIIIYSHGFGVRRDDNRLLSDIADALSGAESILFDYYEADETRKTLTICSFSEQVEKLTKIINEIMSANPDAIIDLIAHSQGTIVAALANPEGIRKAIFLAAVFDLSLERTLERHRLNPEALINLEGVSIIPSKSGGFDRIIPAKYWRERAEIKSFEAYNNFAEKTEIVFVEANQDQLLPKVDLSPLSKKTKVISIDGNHGFEGEAREVLFGIIKKEVEL